MTSAHLSVRDIGRLSLPGPSHNGLLVMLAAYFDDSGTHDNSKVLVWGGFIGTTDQWDRLDAAWRAKLAKPFANYPKPPLRRFHLSPCEARDDEFSGYSRADSDAVQHDFRQIIVDSGVVGLAHAVHRPAWDRLVTKQARAVFGDAEMVCFGACITSAIEQARKHFPGEDSISLHFDMGRRSQRLLGLINTVEANYSELPAIDSISFQPVDKFTPLQAADIIATENYWYAQDVLENDGAKPRPHFRHFLNNVRAEGFLLDEPHILTTLKDHFG